MSLKLTNCSVAASMDGQIPLATPAKIAPPMQAVFSLFEMTFTGMFNTSAFLLFMFCLWGLYNRFKTFICLQLQDMHDRSLLVRTHGRSES